MGSKDSFQFFLQSWLNELNTVVTRLESVHAEELPESEQRNLISAFMEHQELLFSAKSGTANQDPAFGAYLPWINSLCRALQWYGGWRPTVAFRLAEVLHLIPPEKVSATEAMRVVTKAEEVAVEQEKSCVEVIVIRAFMNGGDIYSMETPIMETMQKVAVAADMVRMNAIRRVVDMLPPVEAIMYLVKLGKMEANFFAMDDEEM